MLNFTKQLMLYFTASKRIHRLPQMDVGSDLDPPTSYKPWQWQYGLHQLHVGCETHALHAASFVTNNKPNQ